MSHKYDYNSVMLAFKRYQYQARGYVWTQAWGENLALNDTNVWAHQTSLIKTGNPGGSPEQHTTHK